MNNPPLYPLGPKLRETKKTKRNRGVRKLADQSTAINKKPYTA